MLSCSSKPLEPTKEKKRERHSQVYSSDVFGGEVVTEETIVRKEEAECQATDSNVVEELNLSGTDC